MLIILIEFVKGVGIGVLLLAKLNNTLLLMFTFRVLGHIGHDCQLIWFFSMEHKRCYAERPRYFLYYKESEPELWMKWPVSK